MRVVFDYNLLDWRLDYFHYVNWAGSIFVWLLAFRFLFVYDVIVVHFPIIMLSSSVNGV